MAGRLHLDVQFGTPLPQRAEVIINMLFGTNIVVISGVVAISIDILVSISIDSCK